MPFQVTIENTDETFRCRDEDNVLQAMEQLRRKGIPVGCRNGGCGVCKVKVIEGRYAKKKMSRAVVSEEDEARGCVLACRIYPQSDLRVRVEGKMLRAVVAAGGDSIRFRVLEMTSQMMRRRRMLGVCNGCRFRTTCVVDRTVIGTINNSALSFG